MNYEAPKEGIFVARFISHLTEESNTLVYPLWQPENQPSSPAAAKAASAMRSRKSSKGAASTSSPPPEQYPR